MTTVDHDALKKALNEILNQPMAEAELLLANPPVTINEGVLNVPAAPIVSTSPVYNVEKPKLTRKSEAGLTQDEVNHPNHYARWPMEPIEFIAINDVPWWMYAIIKYIMRYDAKDGLADMYKARSFLEMKIRHLEGVNRFWDQPVAVERKLNAPA